MNREKIKNKYHGMCAYTGKPLEEDWQIDHVISKQLVDYYFRHKNEKIEVDSEDNLMPTLRIVNHYKRAYSLEGFRKYMENFHIRLSKLPKTTNVEKTKRRIEYMNKVAKAFDITIDKPFNGKFYFETLPKNGS